MHNHNIKLLFTLLKTNLKSSVNDRGEFLLKILFMIVNNLIFIAMWCFLFEKYEIINGWKIEHLLFMFGCSAFVFGINNLLFFGVREIPLWVDNGKLDLYLTYPRNILFIAATSNVNVSGLGDMVFGVLLIAASNFLRFQYLLPIIAILLLGTILVFAINTLLASIAFWVRNADSLTKQIYANIIILSSNPPSIYNGFLKIIIFTIIPVGIITSAPVMFLQTGRYKFLFFMLIATAIFSIVSVLLFFSGLKRYESGNLFINSN